MKTISKMFIGTAAAALLGATATTAGAGSCVSFGFGYCRGHHSHWGFGYSLAYCPPPVCYVPRPVYYLPPPPPVLVSPAPAVVYPAPRPAERTLSLADIKALAQSGISDEVIISQIRSTRSVFRLSTAEIIDLKESGVSQRVIDYMINTASGS